MKEADEAAQALQRLQDLTNKYSDMEMDGEELTTSIKDRVNAAEDLKRILRDATEAKRRKDYGGN
tara:strand:- start:595 stop:789 length:195 start_codon:yes stop_codon:yes gene_type:complete